MEKVNTPNGVSAATEGNIQSDKLAQNLKLQNPDILIGDDPKILEQKANICKAIFFDIGGVLVRGGMQLFLDKLAQEIPVAKEDLKNMFHTGELARDLRSGKISLEKFFETTGDIIKRHYDFNIFDQYKSPDELSEMWFEQYKIIEQSLELMKKLKEKGYTIGIISSNFPERFNYIDEKYKITNNLSNPDLLILSYLFQIDKRGQNGQCSELYDKALQISGLNPKQILIIDDGLDVFLKPAANKGFLALYFKEGVSHYEDSEFLKLLLSG